jgi:hypothetical protein
VNREDLGSFERAGRDTAARPEIGRCVSDLRWRDSPSQEGRKSLGRAWIGPRIRGSDVLVVLAIAVLAGCRGESPAFQEAVLEGEAADVSSYAGDWYDDSGSLILRVDVEEKSRVAIRIPRAMSLRSARADTNGILIEIYFVNTKSVLDLRREGPDRLEIHRGADPRGHLGNRIPLVRNPSAGWLAARRADYAGRGLRRDFEGFMDWLARTL